MAMILLMLAAGLATIPDTPYAVQIVSENDRFVMRSLDGAKPLYTYDRDGSGVSRCLKQCASAWPPLAAPRGARTVGNWTVIARADGSRQWAYATRPVYTHARDRNSIAGGDGLDGLWHLLPTFPAKR